LEEREDGFNNGIKDVGEFCKELFGLEVKPVAKEDGVAHGEDRRAGSEVGG
jgi:hypothetical protein